MNRDDILRMADEAGIKQAGYFELERFAHKVYAFAAKTFMDNGLAAYQKGYEAGAKEEREECAKVAFNSKTYIEAAAAIRARGEK